jgi:hypothetical protein
VPHRKVTRAAAAVAPYAILLGVGVASVQALIWLWSASEYLLSPLMALVLVALGAVVGATASIFVVRLRTTPGERGAIDAAVRGAAVGGASSTAVVPFASSVQPSRRQLEPVEVIAVRRVFADRIVALATVLGLVAGVLGIVPAVRRATARRGLPRPSAAPPGTPSPSASASSSPSTLPPSSSPSSFPSATSAAPASSAVPAQLLTDDDVVLVSEADCGNGYPWKAVETTVDGRSYERGAYAVGGSCSTFKGYSLATATYVLSKRFTRFHVVVGIADNAPPIKPVRVEMAIDDADVPKERRSIRVGEPWIVDMPSTAVVRVTFRIYLYDGLPNGAIVIAAGGAGVP